MGEKGFCEYESNDDYILKNIGSSFCQEMKLYIYIYIVSHSCNRQMQFGGMEGMVVIYTKCGLLGINYSSLGCI